MGNETESKSAKAMPKGGRKGGKVFPQYSLEDVLAWADKLVSKTHTSPQAVDVIRASVIQAKSGVANMRISALRQYGLLQGESGAISATELARNIKSAPAEERSTFLVEAALKPDLFGKLFETFNGVSIALPKVRQRASELGVHPDTAEKCAQLYSETMVLAGLAKREGDILDHRESNLADGEVELPGAGVAEADDEPPREEAADTNYEGGAVSPPRARGGRAAVQITISVDSSLDTDKLQKQLELLRKFGAL